MSWFKTNYHIAALGGGVLVLGGLGYLGYSNNATVNETLTTNKPIEKTDTSAPGREMAERIAASVAGPNPIEQKKTPEGRPVNLFTSVDLFTRVGSPNRLLDILKQSPIHPPITNQWWVDHRLDPSYSDSPFRDSDADGFTHLDEFNDKTDPNDFDDYGRLITKLAVDKVESDLWRLDFRALPTAGPQFELTFKPFGGRQTKNQIPTGTGVPDGGIFFDKEPGKGRFKLIEVKPSKTEKDSTGQARLYGKVEDQRANKLGKTYLFPKSPSALEKLRLIQSDHTVVFRLNAIGEGDKPFRIEENGTFSLPAGGEKKEYKLVDVELDKDRKPISVSVEFLEDGKPTVQKIKVS